MMFEQNPHFSLLLFEFVCGYTFFDLLFIGVQFLFKSWCANRSPSVIMDCANKSVSALFSIITVMLSSSVFNSCDTNVMYSKKPLIRHFICFGTPYFLCDLRSMYLVYKQTLLERTSVTSVTLKGFFFKRPVMILHHLAISFIGFPVMMFFTRGVGDCLLACAFLMEASTPFVSARAILANLGYKSSPVYLINGLLMNVIFFFCRITIFPYIYWLYACQLETSILDVILNRVHFYCTFSTFILFLPQIYWFSLMIQGSIKVLRSRKTRQQKVK